MIVSRLHIPGLEPEASAYKTDDFTN